jgi:hypothetical protein
MDWAPPGPGREPQRADIAQSILLRFAAFDMHKARRVGFLWICDEPTGADQFPQAPVCLNAGGKPWRSRVLVALSCKLAAVAWQ